MNALASATLALSLFTLHLSAQSCSTEWLPGQGVPGVYGPVNATVEWDPDGAGPLPPLIVVGGEFTAVDRIPAMSLAFYKPGTGTWTTLGDVDGSVSHLSVLSTGELVIAGRFDSVDGQPIKDVARFDGVTWRPFGAGFPYTGFTGILTTAELPNGDLLVGGEFTGPVGSDNIARFDGTNWGPFGSPDSTIEDLAVLPNGNVVAVGDFFLFNGVQARGAALWDGSQWSAMGNGLNNDAQTVLALPNGQVVAGGDLLNSGTSRASGVALWDGVSWSEIGGGVLGSPGSSRVDDLALMANGDLLVGGGFSSAGGQPISSIARWDGSAWSALGNGVEGAVESITVASSGEVFVGGFPVPNGIRAAGIARFDGTQWSALSQESGIGGFIFEIEPEADGSVIVGGALQLYQGYSLDPMARWDGSTWSTIDCPFEFVRQIELQPNGDYVVAGSSFGIPGGPNIQLWDGTTWSPMGAGLDRTVLTLNRMPNGDLLAGGDFRNPSRVARWDGTQWLPIGQGLDGGVADFAQLPNGDLVAAGGFFTFGGTVMTGLALWNGTAWTPFPGAGSNGSCQDLLVMPNGDLIAAGSFTTLGGLSFGGIARWDGTSWSSMGGGTDGFVYKLHVLPGGDLLAAGVFTRAGSIFANGVARWNGSGWSTFGAGIDGSVTAIEPLADGSFAFGGIFGLAGGAASTSFATLTSTCRATTTSIPSACQGPAGPMELRTVAAPWIAGRYEAEVSGFANAGIGVSIFGFAQLAIPLVQVTPAAGTGCDLLATTDLIELALPTNGSVRTDLKIPNDPTLIGQDLYHQVLQAELAGGVSLTSLSASNGLRLTIGSF